MSSAPLRHAELRSLLLLADVALATPDPPAALVAGARAARWPARLTDAALDLARGMLAGEPPSQCLERSAEPHVVACLRSGEASRDAAEGVRRALLAIERAEDDAEAQRRIATWPMLLFSLAAATCGAVAWKVLPVNVRWLHELTQDFGYSPSLQERGVLALADRSHLTLLVGVILALLPWAAIGGVSALRRTSRMSRLLLMAPASGELLRWRAAAVRLDVFAASLLAGLTPPEAHALAADVVDTGCLRRDARLATERLRTGASLLHALEDSGLPGESMATLTLLAHPGAQAAAVAMAASEARERSAAASRRLGTILAAVSIVGTSLVLIATIALTATGLLTGVHA